MTSIDRRSPHEVTSLIWDDELKNGERHRGDCARVTSQGRLIRERTARRREEGLPGGRFDTRDELIALLRQRSECDCRLCAEIEKIRDRVDRLKRPAAYGEPMIEGL